MHRKSMYIYLEMSKQLVDYFFSFFHVCFRRNYNSIFEPSKIFLGLTKFRKKNNINIYVHK